TPNRLNVGRSDQCFDERFCNLGFEQLWTARPLRVNDDLWVGNIRDSVKRRDSQRVKTADNAYAYKNQNKQSEADDIANDAANHYSSNFDQWTSAYIRNRRRNCRS